MSIWPHPFLNSKKAKNDTFTRKKNGATGLRLSMQTQHRVGLIWPHLFLFVCKAKKAKNGTSKKNNKH